MGAVDCRDVASPIANPGHKLHLLLDFHTDVRRVSEVVVTLPILSDRTQYKRMKFATKGRLSYPHETRLTVTKRRTRRGDYP